VGYATYRIGKRLYITRKVTFFCQIHRHLLAKVIMYLCSIKPRKDIWIQKVAGPLNAFRY